MKTIFDTLEEIKIKPEMYLGAKKLTYLYHFINGYLCKSMDVNDNESPKIRELHFWLPKKTGINVDNWLQNLLIKANFDEEKAIDLFFHYVKIFIEEINHLNSNKPKNSN
jgi:hypothetical protein